MIMKRLTLITLLCAFFLGAFTSCDILDKKYEYQFGYDFEVSIKDEDDSKAVQDYLKTNFIDKKHPSYYANNHDALVYFLDYFVKQRETFDDEFITGHFKDKEDHVIAIASMTSSANKEWVGTRVWRASNGEEADTPSAQ